MISTPVGMRCRACANLRKAPVYNVRGRYLLQALGAAAVIVVAGGFLFTLVAAIVARTLLLSIVIYIVVGLAIGQLLSLAANRKRGLRMQIIAIFTVVLTTLGGPLLGFILTGRFAINLLGLVFVAIACIAAFNQLR